MDNNQPKKYPHRHSIFGPLILIAIGVAFLLQNMGVISGDFWEIIVSLWPLFIIFAGVDGLARREGVAWPTLLIIVGAFFLLKNFNMVDWHGWGSLWKFWPLILVAIGVDLIFKNRPLWMTIFGVVMAVVVVVGGIWLVGFSTQADVGRPAEAQQMLGESISQAELRFSLGAGEMRLRDSNDAEMLVEGEISPEKGREQYAEEKGTATYTLESSPPHISLQNMRWDLGLSQAIPLGIQADMGAGQIVLELEDLELENLTVEQGVGDIEIRLPVGEAYQVEVSQAIGHIRVTVPEGAPLRLKVSRAITALNVPHNFTRHGDYYLSPDYTEEGEAIELQISQAIGNIEVEYGGG